MYSSHCFATQIHVVLLQTQILKACWGAMCFLRRTAVCRGLADVTVRPSFSDHGC